MKRSLRLLFLLLIVSALTTGCGCGGGEEGISLVSIEVRPQQATIPLGAGQQFIATGIYSDKTAKDITGAVTWSSSDKAIAAVSNAEGSKGSATSLAVGSTFITATLGNITGSGTLTVTPAELVSLKVTPANPAIALGATQQFTATGTFTDKTSKDVTTSVVWNSSNSAIATISNSPDSKGIAISLSAGQTTVTATSGKISDFTTLSVTGPSLVSIEVVPVNPSVGYNSSLQFTAIGTFSDNTKKDLTQVVTWSSSDTSIATISNAEGSKGLATTGHKFGDTIITAALGNVSGSTTLRDP